VTSFASQAQPVFIGGTGRSGTSVMGSLLNSHPQLVLPAHENKLIVERGGLRDIVEQLSARYDMKRRHYVIAEFVRWATKLRTLGFQNAELNTRVNALRQQGMDFQKASEIVGRESNAPFSIHAIGSSFGAAHYDDCIRKLVWRLCASILREGMVDTEGLMKPFFFPRAMSRDEALDACRTFLEELYAPILTRSGAVRWCDDSPDNWLYLDFLHDLYPAMRFIHMIRDPRDVAGSYVNQVWAPSDPAITVSMFKAQFADYEAIKARVPAECVLEVRMEDLSADSAAVMERVARFLGVDSEFDLSLFRRERTNTGSYADKIGAENVALIEDELGAWMRKHRYLD
jgi:hypothetical protein